MENVYESICMSVSLIQQILSWCLLCYRWRLLVIHLNSRVMVYWCGSGAGFQGSFCTGKLYVLGSEAVLVWALGLSSVSHGLMCFGALDYQAQSYIGVQVM